MLTAQPCSFQALSAPRSSLPWLLVCSQAIDLLPLTLVAPKQLASMAGDGRCVPASPPGSHLHGSAYISLTQTSPTRTAQNAQSGPGLNEIISCLSTRRLCNRSSSSQLQQLCLQRRQQMPCYILEEQRVMCLLLLRTKTRAGEI